MKTRLLVLLTSVATLACMLGGSAQADKQKKGDAMPTKGESAPDIVVKDTSGKDVQLSDYWEKGPVVLAFYPKAFTGG